MHALLSPREQRPAAGVRRGLPGQSANLRRPGRSELGNRQDTQGGEIVPPPGGTGHEAQRALHPPVKRQGLCRFLAASYYEPGPELAEEKVFDSMLGAATRIQPELAARVRRLGEAF